MISGIHVSPSTVFVSPGDSRKNALPPLLRNQLVHARVLERLPQGYARLLLNGREITARTDMLLRPGEEMKLRVVDNRETILLKLEAPVQKAPSPLISALARFFPGSESAVDIERIPFPRVRSLIHDIALKSGKADPLFLPRLIEKSGLTWENKLAGLMSGKSPPADLKQVLADLILNDIKGSLDQGLRMGVTDNPEGVKTAASLFETLEHFQLLNHQSSESGRFLLPFPVFSEAGFRFGQLLIDAGPPSGSGETTGDRLVHVSFLLDMTHLGPLRADFSILKQDLTGRFLLNDEDTCAYVRSMIPELTDRLAKLAVRVHRIDCAVGDRTAMNGAAFADTLLQAGDDRVVNIVI